ncbi:MAG: hypothetical protein AAF236_12900 [Verrucomicrobiota bacterium]
MTTRRDLIRGGLQGLPLLALAPLAGCTSSGGGSGGSAAVGGRTWAKREYQTKFLASGASMRFSPRGAYGRTWTAELQEGYEKYKNHPDVSYAVKNLGSGGYKATHNADRVQHGGSMPKPAVAACLLEKKKGDLTREEFQHIVNVCDRSINASWRALLTRFDQSDEQFFERKYRLPDVAIRGNAQSPRFYAEFFHRCVNYRLDYGCELLLEAMRRSQFGAGRWYLPRSITYIGGKTGTSAGHKHEGLFFKHRGGSWAIVVYTRNNFGTGGNIWRMGALFGGLFREHIDRSAR